MSCSCNYQSDIRLDGQIDLVAGKKTLLTRLPKGSDQWRFIGQITAGVDNVDIFFEIESEKGITFSQTIKLTDGKIEEWQDIGSCNIFATSNISNHSINWAIVKPLWVLHP
jgi:sensor domain CHASE-containing protein